MTMGALSPPRILRAEGLQQILQPEHVQQPAEDVATIDGRPPPQAQQSLARRVTTDQLADEGQDFVMGSGIAGNPPINTIGLIALTSARGMTSASRLFALSHPRTCARAGMRSS